MPKPSATKHKRSSATDLPAELDFKKLKFVGFGLDALDRYEAERNRTIVLDQDVAAIFHDAKAVNSVLRAFIEATGTGAKNRRKKSA
jgi:hypothetical protein